MASSRLVLRALSRPRINASLRQNLPLIAQCDGRRLLHSSSAYYAKKKKAKGISEDDLFDESSNEDDLFGSASLKSTSDATSARVGPKEVPSSFVSKPSKSAKGASTKARQSQVDKSLAEAERKREAELEAKRKEENHIKELERLERLSEIYGWVQSATGNHGKEQQKRPRQEDLMKLIRLTRTNDDWQNLIGILREWRLHPAETLREVVEHTIIEQAIATRQVPLLIPVLEHHPLYGISVPTPSKARALLKAIVSPIDGYPPYSPSNTAKDATSPGSSTYIQQMELSLRLAGVFAGTVVRVPLQPPTATSEPTSMSFNRIFNGKAYSKSGSGIQPVSMSPAQDLVLGPILLSSIIRAIVFSSSPDEITKCVAAAQELVTALKTAVDVGSAVISPVRGELSWAIAALKEAKSGLESRSIREDGMEGVVTFVTDLVACLEKEDSLRRQNNIALLSARRSLSKDSVRGAYEQEAMDRSPEAVAYS